MSLQMLLIDLAKRLKYAVLEEMYIKPFTRQNIHREINPQNTIALICHPRGGSNWLGEILLNSNNSMLIDEPLWRGFYRDVDYLPPIDSGKIKSLSKIQFYLDQRIPKNSNWPEAKKIFQSILKSEIIMHDLYDRNKLSDLVHKDLFIFKFCFAHLLFPWLHENFKLKSIILHRHPCAVVSSQLKHPVFNFIHNNPSGKIPNFRYNEFHKQYDHIWSNVETKEEYLAAIWAVKTKYVLTHPVQEKDSITVFYENLLVDFNENLKIIQKFLGVDILSKAVKNQQKPSRTSIKPPKLIEQNQQLAKWQHQLSKDQIKRILNIVERFEIDLYDESLTPKAQQ